MPFKKVGKNKFRSPRGKVYTLGELKKYYSRKKKRVAANKIKDKVKKTIDRYNNGPKIKDIKRSKKFIA